MKTEDLVRLLCANAKWCGHISIYDGKWYTDASNIPDIVSCQIGKILALIQDKIKTILRYSYTEEYLLIYNFQMLKLGSPACDENCHEYYSIDAVVRPVAEMDDNTINDGKPCQLVVNYNTGEVMNNTQAMLQLKLITLEDVHKEKMEAGIIYGNYKYYEPLCCFVPFVSDKPVVQSLIVSYELVVQSLKNIIEHEHKQQEFFKKKLKAFDSFNEACAYLEQQDGVSKYILELPYSKNKFANLVEVELDSLSKYTVAITDYKQYVSSGFSKTAFITAFADSEEESEQTQTETKVPCASSS